ncbi:MAG TPA: hypothetical protein VLD36_06300 [Burkholderiales bacterium]|nr:hypothetical protein [Burkholderiales bacterium]
MRTLRALTMGLAVAGLAASIGASAAEPPAPVTLLEGQTALLRGTTRYALAEGVRLQGGDIVEVGDRGLAQIEFADGLVLSLGPGARFYAATLVSRAAKSGGFSEFYLMRGWTKFANGKSAAPFRLSTPVFGLGTGDAIGVAQVGDAEGALFVESGEVRVAEGFVKATPASPIRLRGGEFFVRKSEQKGSIQSRPATAFVSAMPRGYMDNLPRRGAKWKDREVQPRPLGELAYGDVEMWLKAPPEIRRVIMRTFVPKARDAAFRSALVANLRSHPEWDPILFPEKYKPKPPPEPAAEKAPVAGESGAPQ